MQKSNNFFEVETNTLEQIFENNMIEKCNILKMDCEGAELPILQNIKIRPRLIIVEAHPSLNSPKEEVSDLLNKLGYDIISSDARGESLDVLSAIQKD